MGMSLQARRKGRRHELGNRKRERSNKCRPNGPNGMGPNRGQGQQVGATKAHQLCWNSSDLSRVRLILYSDHGFLSHRACRYQVTIGSQPSLHVFEGPRFAETVALSQLTSGGCEKSLLCKRLDALGDH